MTVFSVFAADDNYQVLIALCPIWFVSIPRSTFLWLLLVYDLCIDHHDLLPNRPLLFASTKAFTTNVTTMTR